jgi:hypothetical protein
MARATARVTVTVTGAETRAPVATVLGTVADQVAKADMAMATPDREILVIAQVMGRKLFAVVRPSMAARIPKMPVLNFRVQSVPFAVQ